MYFFFKKIQKWTKNHFFFQKKVFFQNNFRKIFFPKNLLSEEDGKIIFPKNFVKIVFKKIPKPIPKIFEYFFQKNSVWKEMCSKSFKKYFFNVFYCLENPFWHVFGTNLGQKIPFEKRFFEKKNPKSLFFKKKFQNHLKKFQKIFCPKNIIFKKILLQKFKNHFLVNKNYFPREKFQQNSKPFFQKNIFSQKYWIFFKKNSFQHFIDYFCQ